QALPLRQRVTDLEVSGVVDSHDISGPRFIYCLAVLRHKGGRIGESERPILPYMEIVAAAFELSRTHTHKRDPVSVLWVHVGVYLENKAGEPSFLWGDDARSGGPRLWRRCNSYERIEQFFHPEVVHGATKEYRCHFSGAIVVHGKLWIHRFDQFHVSPQLRCVAFAHVLIEACISNILDLDAIFYGLFTWGEKMEAFFVQAIHTFKRLAHADGPA